MSKPDKPRSGWRWLKRGLFAVVVLITLLGIGVVVENARGRSAWAKYKAKLEAAGEPLAHGEMVPTDIPDDQNFAMTPLLAPLTDYEYDTTGQPVFADPEAKRQLNGLFGWTQVIRLGSWRKVRATDWTEVQTNLRSQTNSQFAELDALLARPAGTPAEDLLFLFSLNEKEIEEIGAAVLRPHSSFQSRRGQVNPGTVPQLTVVRRLVHAFSLKAGAERSATNTTRALADWKTCIALGNTLDGDPVLISLLVKLSVIDTSLKTVWEGLHQRSWSDAQLAEIQRALEPINLVVDAKRAFQGERIFGLVGLDQILLAKGGQHESSGMLRGFLLPGWVAQNKVSLGRLYDQAIFPLLDPDQAAIKVAEVEAIDQRVVEEFQRTHPYRMMARMIFPAISKSVLKVANGQTAVHLATVAVALERHRLAHGSHPEALNALVPAYLETIPLDLDRQPLRYQFQPDGSFILYSIGVDLKDDNGRIGKPDGTFSTEEGDWVWKYPEAANR